MGVNEIGALVVVGAGVAAGLGYSFGALRDAGAFSALGHGLRLIGFAVRDSFRLGAATEALRRRLEDLEREAGLGATYLIDERCPCCSGSGRLRVRVDEVDVTLQEEREWQELEAWDRALKVAQVALGPAPRGERRSGACLMICPSCTAQTWVPFGRWICAACGWAANEALDVTAYDDRESRAVWLQPGERIERPARKVFEI